MSTQQSTAEHDSWRLHESIFSRGLTLTPSEQSIQTKGKSYVFIIDGI
jgi:hypothetical protein